MSINTVPDKSRECIVFILPEYIVQESIIIVQWHLGLVIYRTTGEFGLVFLSLIHI